MPSSLEGTDTPRTLEIRLNLKNEVDGHLQRRKVMWCGFRKGYKTYPLWHAQPSVENCSSSPCITLRFNESDFAFRTDLPHRRPQRNAAVFSGTGEPRRTMRRMHPENRFTHRQQGRPINQFGPSVHGEKLSRSKRYTELEVCSNGMCTGATARSKSDKPQLRAFTRAQMHSEGGDRPARHREDDKRLRKGTGTQEE